MNAADNTQVLEEIIGGKYRDSYLIYARRSTDEPDNQKNSISYQKAENARYAARECLPLASLTLSGLCADGVISERHSAFKEANDMEFGEDGSVRYRVERPKFHRLASFLSAGHFKGVIFLSWDRASRNKGDGLIIGKLMKKGVDFRFVLASYDDTSAGELHKDIDGMFAEHHSRVTREKVKGVITKSREKGLCVYRAPVGYLNQGSMENKPLDPDRAPLVKALFEKADGTTWSLSDLHRWIIAQGFTMQPRRRTRTRDEILDDEERDEHRNLEPVARLPTVSQIHVILTNRFYTGQVRGNGRLWMKSASHEALVTDALFERVQRRLSQRRTSIHYEKKLPLPFRGFLRCVCGRIYTPYEQKGIIYLGARCQAGCTNSRKSVNLRFVDEAVTKVIDELIFSDEELARIDAAVIPSSQGVDRQSQEHDAKERRARKLREDLVYLEENRVTLLRAGAYTPEALAADEAKFKTELASLEAAGAFSEAEKAVAAGATVKLSELLKRAQVGLAEAKRDLRETFARLVLSELTISEDTLSYQCRRGFAALQRPSFSNSGPCTWLSELMRHEHDIPDAIASLTALLQENSENVPNIL